MKLAFDENKFQAVLIEEFGAQVDRFDKEIQIPKMQNEIRGWETRRDIDADKKGVNNWAPEIASLVCEFTNNDFAGMVSGIYRQVGINASEQTEPILTRARVIAFGSGYNSLGGGGAIMTKPGQEVWNEQLTHRVMSIAKSSHPVPDRWNEVGTDFVTECVAQQRAEFVNYINYNKNDIVKKALKASIAIR